MSRQVRFLPGTPPYARNKDVTYVITREFTDNTGEAPRQCAWIVNVEDVDKAPSRQRIRSAYLDDVTTVPDDDDEIIDPHADGCPVGNGTGGWCTCTGN